MGEEIAFENGRISNFQGLVTLTLDRVILHTVMHQLPTSTYLPNVIEIEETFCGRMYGRTLATHFIRSTRRSRPKNTDAIKVGIISHSSDSVISMTIYLMACQKTTTFLFVLIYFTQPLFIITTIFNQQSELKFSRPRLNTGSQVYFYASIWSTNIATA